MPIRECVVIEADDYNIKRKPAATAPKQEEPAKPAKPEMPVIQRQPEVRGGDTLNVYEIFYTIRSCYAVLFCFTCFSSDFSNSR